MAESLIRNTLPKTYIRNGDVFSQEPSGNRVFIGSINDVVSKIVRGELA